MINKQHYAKGQYSIWCSGGESGTQENDIIHLHPFLRSLSVNLVCFVDLFARLCFCFCCGNKALKAPLTQCHTTSQIHTPITSTPGLTQGRGKVLCSLYLLLRWPMWCAEEEMVTMREQESCCPDCFRVSRRRLVNRKWPK